MFSPPRRRVLHSGRSVIESLEMRRLLSVALLSGGSASDGSAAASATADAASTTAVLTGMNIYAETNQRFVAVLGKISTLPPQPALHRLRGQINWGDGSPNTYARFILQPGGVIDVLGAHTYTTAGTDDITVTIVAIPPPGSAAPVLLVGSFKSTATVITDPGGVTQEEPVGVHFTQTVGFFRTTLSSLNLTAIIDWGDGQQSTGKILALPVVGPGAGPVAGGFFAVVGDHTYNAVASYLVHTTVYQNDPTATGPPTVVVAKIDSVFDVLPIAPTAATWIGGDTNDDGQVNVADLADMAGNFGVASGATWEMGDFDGNGNVNVADLADLAGNFGTVASFDPSTMTASPSATTATPSTATMMPATPAATPSLDLPGADWTSKFDDLFSAASIVYAGEA
jgi:hypothetical protein